VRASEESLAKNIGASTAARAASVPVIAYPEELPISAAPADIRRAIELMTDGILLAETCHAVWIVTLRVGMSRRIATQQDCICRCFTPTVHQSA